jgi:hypothetical protein
MRMMKVHPALVSPLGERFAPSAVFRENPVRPLGKNGRHPKHAKYRTKPRNITRLQLGLARIVLKPRALRVFA